MSIQTGLSYPLPLRDRIIPAVYALGNVTWRAHRNEVVRYALTAHAGVLAHASMQQPGEPRALHLRHRVFPYHGFVVKMKPLAWKARIRSRENLRPMNPSRSLLAGNSMQ